MYMILYVYEIYIGHLMVKKTLSLEFFLKSPKGAPVFFSK